MKTILWCLIIKILIINVSSAEDFSLKNNELSEETRSEEYQLCHDQQLALNFSNTIVTKVGENFLTSSLISCLKMNNNHITKVSASAFDKIPNLTYLNLAENLIEEDEILYNGRLKNLKILILDNAYNFNNYRTSISFSGYYPSLEKLYLRKNDIISVEMNENNYYYKDSFSKLTHLYLNNNSISIFSIEAKISNAFLALKYVDLNYNEIEYVNINLTEIEFLSFDYNQVLSLTLKGTKKLEKLYAANNQLFKFTEEYLEECEKLKILNLKSNRITTFSNVIFEKCNSLEYLNLDNNKLTELPAINSISYLKRLLLRHNAIKSLSPTTFSMMPHLVALRLDENRIFKVEPNTFSTLVNLQTLTLGNNRIANLPENWSENMKMLQNLNLEGNQFKMFEDLSLTQDDVILNLNLTNNPLKKFTSNSFMVIPENATISLNFNTSCLSNN